MKRIIFYTGLVSVVMLAGIIVFWKHPPSTTNIVATNAVSQATPPVGSEKPAVSQTTNAATNAPPDFAKISAEQNEWLAKNAGITSGMTKEQAQEKMLEWYQAQAAKMAARDQNPILFYGETVDESNQPLSGVSIHFSLNGGLLEKDLQSDANGDFNFSGAVGKLLVIDVHKNGYYTSKSNRVDFDYTSYQPNPLRPELFYLRKKGSGADLITSQYGMKKYLGVPMPLVDSPIHVNLLTRSIGQEGQLILTQTKLAGAASWSFKMEIPGGGFVEEGDEFPFEAPESGYQSVVEFIFQQGQTDWATDILKDYYIKFGNPPRYGHLHLDTAVDMIGARLTYAINPDGSRNLEPK